MAMAEDMVVPGWSSVTADQMKEFWEKVSRKQIGLRNFQNFLDNPNKYADVPAGLTSISKARRILGSKKVIPVTLFNHIWGTGYDEAPIMYLEEDLQAFYYRNKVKDEDWRLIYYSGRSIRQLNEIIGTDKDHQPCFYKYKQAWYLDKEQDFWADKTPDAGYYLINCMGLFPSLKYQDQEREIAKLGNNLERTDPHIFTEAVMSIFKLTGERIAQDWLHRSAISTAIGGRVYLSFDTGAWNVGDGGDAWEYTSDERSRVSVTQKQWCRNT